MGLIGTVSFLQDTAGPIQRGLSLSTPVLSEVGVPAVSIGVRCCLGYKPEGQS